MITKLKAVPYISKYAPIVAKLDEVAAVMGTVTLRGKGNKIREKLLSFEIQGQKKLGAAATDDELLEEVVRSTAGKAAKVDGAPHLYTADKMQKIYEAAACDWTKVPTYSQLKTLFARRAVATLLDAYHTAVVEWTQKLVPGITNAELGTRSNARDLAK